MSPWRPAGPCPYRSPAPSWLPRFATRRRLSVVVVVVVVAVAVVVVVCLFSHPSENKTSSNDAETLVSILIP